MKDIVKHYSTEGLTVKWETAKCIHSAICAKGLPNVFDPRKRPWINIDGASKEDIINQVKKCPSGAISYEADERV